jgi:GT2 family glycosyltransferase
MPEQESINPKEVREGLVSAVILSWNSRRFLLDCIASALAQTYPAIELIVMDNDSSDDSVDLVRSHYPGLPVIVNDCNLGFARAHNKGIRETDGEFYMPLNPDVRLSDNFVAEMVKAARLAEDIGSASGKIYFSDENGPTDRLYSAGHLLPKNRKLANRGYKKKDAGKYGQIDYIFGPDGACPLYKRAMLEDVQMDGQYFDENFFVYAEDYDLCWRGQWLGWRSIYTPHAVAYHYGRGSGGFSSPSIQYQFARNHYMTILKNDYIPHLLLDLPYILLWELIWQTHTLLTNPRRILANVRGYYDACVREMPTVLRRRRELQARKRTTPRYMRSLFVGMTLR